MTQNLLAFRRELDQLDDQILDVLSRRLAVCREIARHKSEAGIPMMQDHRVAEVMTRAAVRARNIGLSENFVLSLYELVIREACRIEDEIIRNSTIDCK